MQFNHRTYSPDETIAAIATPPGEGGVAIIRISGARAFEVGSRLSSRPLDTLDSHTVNYGRVLDADGSTVDRVLFLVMRDGRSYTGEDTVEIHCHGGGGSGRFLDVRRSRKTSPTICSGLPCAVPSRRNVCLVFVRPSDVLTRSGQFPDVSIWASVLRINASLSSCVRFFLINFDATVSDRSTTSARICWSARAVSSSI